MEKPIGAFLLLIAVGCATAKDQYMNVTAMAFMDITIGGEEVGRIEIGLFGDIVPKTVENFYNIANGTYPDKSYKGTIFHRVIDGFMMQGGQGGGSIYGGNFADENFNLSLFPGCLAMANSGPNTNGAQFFITFEETDWLNGKHVVFGKVLKGTEVVNKVQYNKVDGHDRPLREVKIADCGVIPVEVPYIVTEERA